jgi:branched-chain amino acid transport system ATP-binding protein
LKQKKITTLLAEQNLQFALQVGDYYYLIDNGANVFSGDRKELYTNQEVQIRYLGVGISMG